MMNGGCFIRLGMDCSIGIVVMGTRVTFCSCRWGNSPWLEGPLNQCCSQIHPICWMRWSTIVSPPKFPGHFPHLGFGQGQSFMKPPSRAIEAVHWDPKDGSFSLQPLDPSQLARGAPHQSRCRAVHFSQEDWGGPQNEHGKNLGLKFLRMVTGWSGWSSTEVSIHISLLHDIIYLHKICPCFMMVNRSTLTSYETIPIVSPCLMLIKTTLWGSHHTMSSILPILGLHHLSHLQWEVPWKFNK